jgi:N6-adenosine-specific RNA methylase IME4
MRKSGKTTKECAAFFHVSVQAIRQCLKKFGIEVASLRSFRDVKRICRQLHPYVGSLTLNQITGDVVWTIAQGELKRGNKPATVNRYLALIRNLLHMARDEW